MKILAAMGIPVLWNNVVLPRLQLGMRHRTVANVAFATGYAAVFGVGGHRGGELSRPPARWSSMRGLRWGTALAAAVTAGYAALLTIPSTRARLAEFTARTPEVGVAEWVTIHIPLGTVYSEELIFRATLDPLLDGCDSSLGTWLGPTTFGLWHITPARTAGDSVPGTVALTTLGGLTLSLLRRRTGSTIAPALLHLALNIGGAVAPLVAERLPPHTRRS